MEPKRCIPGLVGVLGSPGPHTCGRKGFPWGGAGCVSQLLPRALSSHGAQGHRGQWWGDGRVTSG